MIHIIPNLGGQSTILSGVAVVAANNIWAVGEYIDNSGIYQTLIEHWNGKLWSLVSSPNLGSDDSYLLDTATIPDTAHVWAVGYAYGTTASTLTEYFC